MINAVHLLFNSVNPEADRAFLKDVLGFKFVDDGQGWLIFKLPPSEVAIHPAEKGGGCDLYFICDDLDATLAEWTAKGAQVLSPPSKHDWGTMAWLRLPGGAELGVYQALHKTAYDL